MIVTIHQPESMPWLGYFSKMDAADQYIILNDCQYRKDYYQNRNRIRTPNGLEYITIPVVKDGISHISINEVRIHNDPKLLRRYMNTISRNYIGAPYYDDIMGCLTEVYSKDYEYIWELNMGIIHAFRSLLGIDTPIVYSSDLLVLTTGSLRNADLVRTVGGDIYLSGPSGRDYLDMDDFHGIGVIYHDYVHPVYNQLHDKFIPYASTLDLLMNHSPMESIRIIRSGYKLIL